MQDTDIAIKLENVSKTFHIRDKTNNSILGSLGNAISGKDRRVIKAVKNVDLEIKKGEFFGIVGANGSGKSTLLHLMSGAYRPDKGGTATINGSFIGLSLGMGFNNELTARENVFLNASVLGLPMKRIKKKFNKIIEFAELEDFVNTKVKYFSRGMRARLAFAIAVHAEADIFIMDEFFGGVGDEKFKGRSDKAFEEAIVKGRTIIHVSHNLSTIKKYASRVMLMHEGECLIVGTVEEVFLHYQKTLKISSLEVNDR
jgi:ABC-2 type transport system ATP-binding protein